MHIDGTVLGIRLFIDVHVVVVVAVVVVVCHGVIGGSQVYSFSINRSDFSLCVSVYR